MLDYHWPCIYDVSVVVDGSEHVIRCVQLCGCVYRRCRQVGSMLGQRRRISTSIEIPMTKSLCLPRWMALPSQCSMFLGSVLKSSMSLKCTIPVIYMPPPPVANLLLQLSLVIRKAMHNFSHLQAPSPDADSLFSFV